MNEKSLRAALRPLPLGTLDYHDCLGSTNDQALAWAVSGAPDLSLVYSEEQTAGRGRGERVWVTPAHTALAFSLILRPGAAETAVPSLLSGLAAVAVCQALEETGLAPEIKWPNDILLGGRKLGGVLVEAVWSGDHLDCFVLGVGVNVLSRAVPAIGKLQFPATSLEDETGHPVDRLELLKEILVALLSWRKRMTGDLLCQAWESRLAYRGREVELIPDQGETRRGRLLGLNSDGSLRLAGGDGQVLLVRCGDIRLRPQV
jgi:BirA family biotin operon repressor/biotin-[acetyl-CoA-carboxylase] ligase